MTPDGVWDHFVQIVAPAISKRQIEDACTEKAGSGDLVKLLQEALKKAINSNEDMSEVNKTL